MAARLRVRTALAVVSAGFAVLILVQVFLAGLGVFAGASSFATHREFGYLIGWLTLVIVVLAIAGRTGRRVIALSVIALVQMALQSVFVLVRADLPAVAALHPVNGTLLLLVVTAIARSAWRMREIGPSPVTRTIPERGVLS